MDKSELVSELKHWCRGEGLDKTHWLTTIVPEDVEIGEVEETLGTIKSLGRVLTSDILCSNVKTVALTSPSREQTFLLLRKVWAYSVTETTI
uniref:Uncharacterized protein n=1 Tax=Fundulus heteroclitus TaxID=8078 RepID=A0A3Q2U715_FUNHE